MAVLIDPPEGWRFGFPKPAPVGVGRDAFFAKLGDWLVENGYPRRLLERCDAVACCRVIGEFDDGAMAVQSLSNPIRAARSR